MKPREKAEVGGITAHTSASTDMGVSFLVQADGLSVFHAGDNADWGDGESNRIYYAEIDHLAALGGPVDLAFIPICTYMGERPPAMTDGAIYAVRKLAPAVTFPMHANGREHLYKEFERDLRAAGSDARVICAEPPGPQRTDLLKI